MKRLLLYAGAALVALFMAALAWAIPEARFAFAAVSVVCAGGLYWIAQRFPEMGRAHLRVAALLTLVGSIALAAFLPSTGQAPCPVPGGCADAIDHHTLLRLVILVVGVIGSGAMMVHASRLPIGDATREGSSAG